MNWLDIWRRLSFGAKSIKVTVPLGSGYSVDKERDSSREKLKAICEQVVKDTVFQQKEDGTTFCNMASRLIARTMGCEVFGENDLAVVMGWKMAAGNGFRLDTGARAAEHAQNGGLAFAFHDYSPHAHITAIYPSPMQESASWGKPVPLVAHVGKAPNGIIRASQAFPVAQGEPSYYLWGEV